MSREQPSTLIADAPVGRHFAQLHRDAAELVEAVAELVEAGLRRGNGVLLIVTAEHADGIMERLESFGLDPESQRRSGQLAVYDARSVLNRILRTEMPSWSEFRRVVGSALESVQQLAGRSATRAYGEMVDLLWRDGQQQAAIRLEEYWNELGRHYPFSLFCGYLLDSHQADCYCTPLHEIGRTHSDVLASAEDDRFHDAVDAPAPTCSGFRCRRC